MIATVDELRTLIHEHKLERWEEKIVALAKPAVAILKARVIDEEEIPLGASKMGGSPDLPQGVEWSFYQGIPLTFIAQFKLSEVAPYDVEKLLPESGMLYFFYEADAASWEEFSGHDAWKIIYVQDEQTPIVRTQHPTQKAKWGAIQALPCHQITYEPYISLPMIFFDESNEFGVDFSEEESAAYWEVVTNRKFPDHHLVGYPLRVHDFVESDAVVRQHRIKPKKLAEPNHYGYSDQDLAFIRREMLNWQFLFQIDTDDYLKVMWSDVGTLYICIPKESLKQRKFEDCWTIVQCC